MPKGNNDFGDLPPDAFGPPPGEKTYPCKNCGRKFVKDTLEKHEKICKKTQKKRKPFESGKQRAGEGSDVNYQNVKAVQKEIQKNNGKFKPPKTNWKERHEQFVSNVRAAKHVDYALKTGTPLPPPPKSTVPSDYVKCPYCGRNFNKSAADRHIPHCKESKSRNPLPGAINGKQKEAMKARHGSPARPAGGSAGKGAKSTIPKPVKRSSSAPRTGQANKPPPGSKGRNASPMTRNTNNMKKMGIRK